MCLFQVVVCGRVRICLGCAPGSFTGAFSVMGFELVFQTTTTRLLTHTCFCGGVALSTALHAYACVSSCSAKRGGEN